MCSHMKTHLLQFLYRVLPGTPELGGAGGAAAPLAFCWEGQGGKKCPLSIKNII